MPLFHETINGRAYVIEVRLVARDRWRAQIAGSTGTALMPFYGETPDEAAKQLAGWLNRANRPQQAAQTDAAAGGRRSS